MKKKSLQEVHRDDGFAGGEIILNDKTVDSDEKDSDGTETVCPFKDGWNRD